MELKSYDVKFNLTTKLTMKYDVAKQAKSLNVDVDTLLDEYICDSNNVENIHDLIEKHLVSNLNIDSMNFIENETIVDAYDDESIDIVCQCAINAREMFCKNKESKEIEDCLAKSSFWFNKQNMCIEECSLEYCI